MIEIQNGCSRKVFLWWKYALKIPQTSYGIRHFYHGLVHNLQERSWWATLPRAANCCPIIASSRFGLFVLMPRCAPLKKELTREQFNALVKSEHWQIPAEFKDDSFGELPDGRIVAVDYGDGPYKGKGRGAE